MTFVVLANWMRAFRRNILIMTTLRNRLVKDLKDDGYDFQEADLQESHAEHEHDMNLLLERQ